MIVYRLVITIIFQLIFGLNLIAQSGCTDPLANNYNSAALVNDGSCTYQNASILPTVSQNLPSLLNETSGLILWNDKIWTHNDNADINLYYFHPDSLSMLNNIQLSSTVNIDEEEISQDSNYIYLGDFGNNANGNRTDLRILRIDKADLIQNIITIDTIFFSYSDQIDFTPRGANNTDFDCESFIVGRDSIFLFTKQWVSQKTAKYSLPKMPGTHIAQYSSQLDVQGLVTAATYLEDKRLIILTGYSTLVQPFIYLLYDFNDNDFFAANKRKISLNLGFHQVEGICTLDGLNCYITNERLSYSWITVEPKLHKIDLGSFLNNYLNPPISNTEIQNNSYCNFYPNPASEKLNFGIDNHQATEILLSDLTKGQSILCNLSDSHTFDLLPLNVKGFYQVSLLDDKGKVICSEKIFIK